MSKKNLTYREKSGLKFVEQEDPPFIKEMKKKHGYREGPKLEDKFVPDDVADDGDDTPEGELLRTREEDRPQVVVLNPETDLTQEDLDKALVAQQKNEDDQKIADEKIVLKKPVKRSATDEKDANQKTINGSVLPFDEENLSERDERLLASYKQKFVQIAPPPLSSTCTLFLKRGDHTEKQISTIYWNNHIPQISSENETLLQESCVDIRNHILCYSNPYTFLNHLENPAKQRLIPKTIITRWNQESKVDVKRYEHSFGGRPARDAARLQKLTAAYAKRCYGIDLEDIKQRFEEKNISEPLNIQSNLVPNMPFTGVMASIIQIKSEFDTEWRRFSLPTRQGLPCFKGFYNIVEKLHHLEAVPFTLYNNSIQGDLLPITNDENLRKSFESARPTLRLLIQRKGESWEEKYGYGTDSDRKKKGISALIEKPPKRNYSISNPEDFRQVSAIIDVDIVPEAHRRVRLCKHGHADRPLGFYIREGQTDRLTERGVQKVQGIFISRLVEGGLAESTGLLAVNDEILEVNGIDVNGKTAMDVASLMAITSQTLIITVKPANQRNTLQRHTSSRSQQPMPEEDSDSEDEMTCTPQ